MGTREREAGERWSRETQDRSLWSGRQEGHTATGWTLPRPHGGRERSGGNAGTQFHLGRGDAGRGSDASFSHSPSPDSWALARGDLAPFLPPGSRSAVPTARRTPTRCPDSPGAAGPGGSGATHFPWIPGAHGDPRGSGQVRQPWAGRRWLAVHSHARRASGPRRAAPGGGQLPPVCPALLAAPQAAAPSRHRLLL